MSRTPRSKSTSKYHLDMSVNKYRTREEELLNILFYSKELPNDLYKHMNISYDNYRKYLSFLMKKRYIKKIHKDRTIGYILTTEGKKLTRTKLEYQKYKEITEDNDRHVTDIRRRYRRRQFAYLYVLFDRAGVIYESHKKPILNVNTVHSVEVYFYTALDVKRLIGDEATILQGSRLLGFFIGKEKIIPLYRTNYVLNPFTVTENYIPKFISDHFYVEANTAVLICNNSDVVTRISEQLVHNNSAENDIEVKTAEYKYFYVFPDDDNFLSYYEDLYMDYSMIERELIEQYRINTGEVSDDGIMRVNLGTGYIDNKFPVLIYPGNINLVQLKSFIRDIELSKLPCYIICRERDKDRIETLSSKIDANIITL